MRETLINGGSDGGIGVEMAACSTLCQVEGVVVMLKNTIYSTQGKVRGVRVCVWVGRGGGGGEAKCQCSPPTASTAE